MNTLALKSPAKNRSPSPTRASNPRSPNKLAKSPYRSFSPQKKKLSKADDDAVIDKLKKVREKICASLDAYTVILSTDSPMRCLEHNSVLSLYC